MLATSIRPPTVQEIRKLNLADIAIAAGLAYGLRDRLKEHVRIDAFTVADPFADKDDHIYSVVVDRENPNRIVAMIVNKKDSLPQLPWTTILGEKLAKIQIPKSEAKEIKHELMPKETGNFYPYRRGNRIAGFFMFAFQICGQR
ncbi:MAG: hypothetical protein DA330_08295 [Nitrososphaera sp.]|nr:hypothetical protein [Nitrososphaera sp.]